MEKKEALEAGSTRLTLSRQPVKPVSIKNGEVVTNKQRRNADTDAETCYIQIRERTARTRQRKVREHSDELPNLTIESPAEPKDGGNAAKLREALERIVNERGILDFCHNNLGSKTWEDWDKVYKTLRKWIDEAMSALAPATEQEGGNNANK